ncbi:hypothetical protein FIBSPDRAFT_593151 [Athelia psychrophila]|uniref:Uncharacterized protein n=1 Tax=Athelia psychrophila TaxID=1759441 RepID=A0A166H5K5_9AGAM|nr:hypothetical protein FIBSPDRAFT_593151 [Fibularhizoctonia sp. CBS 109695]
MLSKSVQFRKDKCSYTTRPSISAEIVAIPSYLFTLVERGSETPPPLNGSRTEELFRRNFDCHMPL